MQYKLFLFGLICLILVGCSSQPLFDVLSEDEGLDYYQGKEVVSCNDATAKTILNFEGQDGEFFVFYLHARNTSERKYDIHPEQIFLEITEPNYSVNDKRAIVYYFAVDPEQELSMIDKDMENRSDEHVAMNVANCLFGIFSVVHDVSNDSDDQDIKYDWAGNMVDEGIDYDEDMDELYASKQFWKNEALRITTLDMNEKIGGLVYVPFAKTAKKFEIHIPIDDTEHVYSFKQIPTNQ